MAQLSITRIRDLVRSLNYVVSVHSAEELEDEDLTILDLENILLTGTIVERQKDRGTRETKFVIRGRTLDDRCARPACGDAAARCRCSHGACPASANQDS